MGAPSVMHRDPERVALVIPVVIMGMDGGLERVRGGEVRRCENARMHCDEAMCFLRLLPASATCRLLRFLSAPVLRGHPLLRPPAPPADTGVS